MTSATIPGYRLHDRELPPAGLSMTDLDRLMQSLTMNDSDLVALREAREIVAPHVSELVETWYDFIGGHDFLLETFSTPSGPDTEYLARVRARFEQWVHDTLEGNFDEQWLKYQGEIGRRHTPLAKNKTDNVEGAPDVVPLRYLVGVTYPIFATMRPFLERGAKDTAHLERMHQAWLKAVLLSVALWCQPYTRDGWY